MGEIATASNEQRQGIEQVNVAVSQMDKVTQSNASSAEETASAAEELNAQSMTLKEVVNELAGLVGETQTDSRHADVLPPPVKHTPSAPVVHLPRKTAPALSKTIGTAKTSAGDLHFKEI